MVKKFTGQVKASEIQALFEEFTTAINTMVQNYNTAIDLSDMDFSKGSASLGAYNYTLTIGGLKTLLSACDGVIEGFKVFRNGNGLRTTQGLYVKDNHVYKIPAYYATSIAGKYIHWNPSTSVFTVNNNFNPPTGSVRLAAIDAKRERSAEMNDLPSVEIVGSDLKIKVGNKYKAQDDSNSFNTTNNPIFLCGCEECANEGVPKRALMFGEEVSYNAQPGHRRRTYWQIVNALYIPKGAGNPYTYQVLRSGSWQNGGNTQMTMPVEKKYS